MSNYPGVEINLGGEIRILPALSAGGVKQHRAKIASVAAGQFPDAELVSVLAWSALKRNYPHITQEQVDDWIDYRNLILVWDSVMNISGLAIEGGKLTRRVHEAMQATGLSTP